MRIRAETVADYNGVFHVNVKAFSDREDETIRGTGECLYGL
ncbi:hypothetical protein [Paenibacillus odorifer]|nr:hypothetical protein [Paenibacillus odorifer]